MEVKFDVTPAQLKRLMGSSQTDKEVVTRLINAINQSEFFKSIDDLASDIVAHILNTVTVKANERGFSIAATAMFYITNVKPQKMDKEVFDMLVDMVRNRLLKMGLIYKHPECDKVADNDLWKFGENQPAIFRDSAAFHFAHTFSQFK
ncbi:hypothetical protein JOAD_179 [Erwinia phage vB_EamM_Joad]|uniref:Uncharacterized protein n=1 Tax=Erwinia phage vB_EamM_Joad TaxID=2026081 RepID=A0A223LJJ2_9CAUD|nr:hypothetical protein JOAD_179 [Erwinia phage vB_EamM_Joad]